MHYSTRDLARFIKEKLDALPIETYDRVIRDWNIGAPLVDLITAGYIRTVTREGRQSMDELYDFLEFPENWRTS